MDDAGYILTDKTSTKTTYLGCCMMSKIKIIETITAAGTDMAALELKDTQEFKFLMLLTILQVGYHSGILIITKTRQKFYL